MNALQQRRLSKQVNGDPEHVLAVGRIQLVVDNSDLVEVPVPFEVLKALQHFYIEAVELEQLVWNGWDVNQLIVNEELLGYEFCD